MMRLTEAARATGGSLRGEDREFGAVTSDTRTLTAGALFVALKGGRFDGHDFVAQAAAAGAAAALVQESGLGKAEGCPMPLIAVQDTRLALGRLAAYWRAKFTLPLVALTGSSGKTTVKEMLAGILRGLGGEEAVLATRGNLNNDIGLPLTLLELKPSHRYAVIEMGMNHAGEIRYLVGLAAPDVALVSNAGRAHLEFLGSEEAIARAKGEIFEGLEVDGTAVINADDRFAPLWRALAAGRKQVDFGLDRPAAVSASCELRPFDSGMVLQTPRGSTSVTLPAPGLHNVRNALAASAAAVALDVGVADIARGLTRFGGVKGRLQRKPARNGAVLVDDTYNANPDSVAAAIEALARMPGRRVLVLGDMGELGPEAGALHAEAGRAAAARGIDVLYTLGSLAEQAARAFGSAARHFSRIEDLLAELEKALAPGATLLVKGSRFMRMERVVNALAAGESACS
jgi:UDP-N-acetylmuramoyl-tripeptide--D-alanyl-D-alanine ligase